MKTRSWRSKLRLSYFPPANKRVAIVVPLTSRPEMTEAERTSLRHLYRHLSGYDIFFLVPPDTTPDLPADARVICFPEKYFGSALAHSRMQLSPVFYEHFIDYQYILMYHLDALVFSDALESWLDKGLDFIGAPWIKTDKTPWVNEPEVGNSGFALMNVRSFLRALYSRRRRVTVRDELAKIRQSGVSGLSGVFSRLWALRRVLRYRNDVYTDIEYMLDQGRLSDLFWSRMARHYYPGFKIASVQEALRFSFEADPYGCFEKTGRKLPFGCHAWEKFEPSFWTPYLLTGQEHAVKSKAVV